MLGGVAFFSYIMGVLFELMTSYKQKMGDVDLSGDLTRWLLTLARYQKMPISYSIHQQIQEDINYFWRTDRMMVMRENGSYQTEILPYTLKKEIVTKHLFIDIVKPNPRFFDPLLNLKNDDFIYDCCIGLVPRIYNAHDEIDKLIMMEN